MKESGPGSMPRVLRPALPNIVPLLQRRRGKRDPIADVVSTEVSVLGLGRASNASQCELPPIVQARNFSHLTSYTVGEASEILNRIEHRKSIKGMLKAVRYTHNTSPQGFLGLLATKRFLGTVERNVNWRLDLDSRYAGGVTYIMKSD
ncbi:MAG: hypothetical protein K5Q00_05265, partial [Gammaproteobacteria bacterium]|nr:hypothetical protein [Gammaproteobacteria bacterium]